MIPHSASLAIAALTASLLLASCSKSSSRGFHRVELTKEDVVSLFNVPIDKSSLGKFEWSLGHPRYLRAVVEKSDDAGRTWSEFRSFPRDIAVVEANLIYKMDRIEPVGAGNPIRYILRVRLGGSGGTFTGWNESSCMLEFPELKMQSESHFDDPARILLVSSGTRAYRLRLETNEKPAAKS